MTTTSKMCAPITQRDHNGRRFAMAKIPFSTPARVPRPPSAETDRRYLDESLLESSATDRGVEYKPHSPKNREPVLADLPAVTGLNSQDNRDVPIPRIRHVDQCAAVAGQNAATCTTRRSRRVSPSGLGRHVL